MQSLRIIFFTACKKKNYDTLAASTTVIVPVLRQKKLATTGLFLKYLYSFDPFVSSRPVYENIPSAGQQNRQIMYEIYIILFDILIQYKSQLKATDCFNSYGVEPPNIK